MSSLPSVTVSAITESVAVSVSVSVSAATHSVLRCVYTDLGAFSHLLPFHDWSAWHVLALIIADTCANFGSLPALLATTRSTRKFCLMHMHELTSEEIHPFTALVFRSLFLQVMLLLRRRHGRRRSAC